MAPLCIIERERGDRSALTPCFVGDTSQLVLTAKAYLVPESLASSIVLSEVEDKSNCYFVDERLSPVLVFNPSVADDSGALRVGRFYFPFSNRAPKWYKRQVRTLFQWLKDSSSRNPIWRGYYTLPSALKHALAFSQWIGPSKPNPLFEPR